MGMFIGMRPGSWWVRSKSDPRWNLDGHGNVGMFSCPEEATYLLAEVIQRLGEDPPDDLEWGYLKD